MGFPHTFDRVRCHVAGLPCPLHRADKNKSEGLFRQHQAEPLSEAPTVVCERDICRASVLATQAPSGLTHA